MGRKRSSRGIRAVQRDRKRKSYGIAGRARKKPAGRGMAIAGLVLNGIFLIGWGLLLVFAFGLLGLIATGAAVG